MKKSLFKYPFYLSDGGLETTIIYQHSVPLNCFAAFELLTTDAGRNELRRYYMPYLELAARHNLPFVVESPTWRASTDWGVRLGYTHDELFAINKQSILFLRETLGYFAATLPDLLFSGNIGPRGDGYKVESTMSVQQAKAYHIEQVKAFALADVDLVSAFTINYTEEACGIIEAAKSFNMPVVVSFTVETDGNLPSGETLREAIETVDKQTGHFAEHYMINCAHTDHFRSRLIPDGDWIYRIKGIRANASAKSHAELDASEVLDAGDKDVLAEGYRFIFESIPSLKVIGGCCGTDHTHAAHICEHLKDRLEGFGEKHVE